MFLWYFVGQKYIPNSYHQRLIISLSSAVRHLSEFRAIIVVCLVLFYVKGKAITFFWHKQRGTAVKVENIDSYSPFLSCTCLVSFSFIPSFRPSFPPPPDPVTSAPLSVSPWREGTSQYLLSILSFISKLNDNLPIYVFSSS